MQITTMFVVLQRLKYQQRKFFGLIALLKTKFSPITYPSMVFYL